MIAECVKLNGKTIVCMNLSPVKLLHIAKAPEQQTADENPNDLAAGVVSFDLASQADYSSDCDITMCDQLPG